MYKRQRLDCADCLDFGFMEEMRRRTGEKKEDFWLMGEVIHGDYSRYIQDGQKMLHSVTNYELHKGIYSGHNDHNYFEIAHTIRREFEENGGIYRGMKLYSFVDNHDVDRIYSKINVKEHIYPIYTLLYTLPGIPSIYYGSEWGTVSYTHLLRVLAFAYKRMEAGTQLCVNDEDDQVFLGPVSYTHLDVYKRQALVSDDFSVTGLKHFFDILLAQKEGAVLWHCSAGKDRVGTATALLLTALGVEREVIIRDYLLTNGYLEPETEAMVAKVAAKVQNERLLTGIRILNGAERSYIESMFAETERPVSYTHLSGRSALQSG